MASPDDHPDIVARPPLIYAVALVSVLLLRWLWPLPVTAPMLALGGGAVLIAVGLAIGIPARRALGVAKTNVNPMRPTTTIVESSSYSFSRNPLYVGLSVVFIGSSLMFNTWWGAVVLVPLSAVMHVGVVLREERYLEEKFGELFRCYCRRVRRYL